MNISPITQDPLSVERSLDAPTPLEDELAAEEIQEFILDFFEDPGASSILEED